MNLHKTAIVFLISFVLFLSESSVFGAQTVIKGNAPSYAGTEIIFNVYDNFITYQEKEITRCIVSDSGDFEASIDINNTTLVVSHLGIYMGYFYAEPEKTYELSLPIRKEKMEADKMNPYFSETLVSFGFVKYDDKELNFLIRVFEDRYTAYFNKHVTNGREKVSVAELENDIKETDAPFADSICVFFNQYRFYRYGLLRFMATRAANKNTIKYMFYNRPVLYNNSSYMEFFNEVFYRYFATLMNTNTKLAEKLDTKLLKDLRQIIISDIPYVCDTLSELILIKAAFDELYSASSIPQKILLNVLDIVAKQSEIAENRSIAQSIYNKATRLNTGSIAPSFELYDTAGTVVRLRDFKGEYIYLNFCSFKSYGCIKEFEALKVLHDDFNDRIKVITVAVDSDIDKMKKQISEKGYKWLFLHYGNSPQIIKDYDVRAFPLYYFIGPDSRLILSPAPTPEEGAAVRIYEIIKK